MATIVDTVVIKTSSRQEYEAAVKRLEDEQAKTSGWTLTKHPLKLQVEAQKVEEVELL